MSELGFAQDMMRNHIAPPSTAQMVKERIRIAARRLGWGFNRTKDVWYADERVSIKPRELRQIEDVVGVQYARRELKENQILIDRAEALLMGNDADFYSAFVTALRETLGVRNRS